MRGGVSRLGGQPDRGAVGVDVDDAVADQQHPRLGPGKRPRLTPNPAIAVRDDGSVIPFGAPGGDVQVQAMLQWFLNASISEWTSSRRSSSRALPPSGSPTPSRPTPTCPEG